MASILSLWIRYYWRDQILFFLSLVWQFWLRAGCFVVSPCSIYRVLTASWNTNSGILNEFYLTSKKVWKTSNSTGNSLNFAQNRSFNFMEFLLSSLFYFVSTHSQPFGYFVHCVLNTLEAFPYSDRHGCGYYPGPYRTQHTEGFSLFG